MNLNELEKANSLASKIENTKLQLLLCENSKIKSLTFRVFDKDTTLYSDVEFSKELPTSVIKKAMTDFLKNELVNLQSQFDKFLTPRKEITDTI